MAEASERSQIQEWRMPAAAAGALRLASRLAGPTQWAERLGARSRPLVIGSFGAQLAGRFSPVSAPGLLAQRLAERFTPAEGASSGADLTLAPQHGPQRWFAPVQRAAAPARWSTPAPPPAPEVSAGLRADPLASELAAFGWGDVSEASAPHTPGAQGEAGTHAPGAIHRAASPAGAAGPGAPPAARQAASLTEVSRLARAARPTPEPPADSRPAARPPAGDGPLASPDASRPPPEPGVARAQPRAPEPTASSGTAAPAPAAPSAGGVRSDRSAAPATEPEREISLRSAAGTPERAAAAQAAADSRVARAASPDTAQHASGEGQPGGGPAQGAAVRPATGEGGGPQALPPLRLAVQRATGLLRPAPRDPLQRMGVTPDDAVLAGRQRVPARDAQAAEMPHEPAMDPAMRAGSLAGARPADADLMRRADLAGAQPVGQPAGGAVVVRQADHAPPGIANVAGDPGAPAAFGVAADVGRGTPAPAECDDWPPSAAGVSEAGAAAGVGSVASAPGWPPAGSVRRGGAALSSAYQPSSPLPLAALLARRHSAGASRAAPLVLLRDQPGVAGRTYSSAGQAAPGVAPLVHRASRVEAGPPIEAHDATVAGRPAQLRHDAPAAEVAQAVRAAGIAPADPVADVRRQRLADDAPDEGRAPPHAWISADTSEPELLVGGALTWPGPAPIAPALGLLRRSPALAWEAAMRSAGAAPVPAPSPAGPSSFGAGALLPLQRMPPSSGAPWPAARPGAPEGASDATPPDVGWDMFSHTAAGVVGMPLLQRHVAQTPAASERASVYAGAAAALELSRPAAADVWRAPAAPPESPPPPGADTGQPAQDQVGPNIEQIAQKVYDHLRRRLLIDHERRGRPL